MKTKIKVAMITGGLSLVGVIIAVYYTSKADKPTVQPSSTNNQHVIGDQNRLAGENYFEGAVHSQSGKKAKEK